MYNVGYRLLATGADPVGAAGLLHPPKSMSTHWKLGEKWMKNSLTFPLGSHVRDKCVCFTFSHWVKTHCQTAPPHYKATVGTAFVTNAFHYMSWLRVSEPPLGKYKLPEYFVVSRENMMYTDTTNIPSHFSKSLFHHYVNITKRKAFIRFSH